ncbi:haloacid dehalogenase-like hydrolase [Streptomyces sp. NPDC050095]|uniref:HAD family hydrolase n=1 Tax=unclassified Streptomyces TaxID=2593676 RepID=UPI0034250103
MAIRLAVLDLDGTLLDGFVAAAMATTLTRSHSRVPAAAREALAAIDAYKSGTIDHDACATRFYPAYGRAVRGLPTAVLTQVGHQAWQQVCARLFPYAAELVTLLKRRGFVTCLLSGSPEEAVLCAADELDMDHAWGLKFAFDEGLCTGRPLRAPALRGAKRPVLLHATSLLEADSGTSVDWAGSFAMGDSSADIDVLDMVGTPLAFEPDPGLLSAATSHDWQVTDRRRVLEHCRAVLDAGPVPRA